MKQLTINSVNKIKKLPFFLIVLAWSVFLTLDATGQTLSSSTDANTPSGLAPGSPAGSYSLTGFENVNLFNGNVNFNLPLLKIGGRGEAQMPVNFTLDSVHWKVDKERVSSDLEGAPPCPGTGAGGCYRLVVNQSSTTGAGIYYSSNPEKWDWEIKPQYSPGNLQGRRSGINTGGTAYFDYTVTTLTFTAPDGTEYELRDKPTSGQFQTGTASGYNRGKIFASFNGEAVTFISDSDIYDSRQPGGASLPFYPSGILWTANGARYRIVDGLVRSMRDRNGNELRFTYNGNRVATITDSLNRTVSFAYTGTADTITYAGFGGTTRAITVQRTSMSNALRPQSGYAIRHYDDLFALNGNSDADYNPDVVSEIILPDSRRYKLFYNEYGELARVELPTRGAIEYDYTAGANSIFTGNGTPQIHRRVLERRVYSNGGTGSTYDLKQTFSPTYGGSGTASSPWTTTVAVEQKDTNGNFLTKDVHYFDGSPIASLVDFSARTKIYSGWNEAKETKTESYNSSGTLLRTTENVYDQKSHFSWWTGLAANEPANDARLIRVETTLNDTNQKTKTEYAYDDFNNQTEVKEYDYGNNNTFGGLLRRTVTGYVDATTLINGKDYVCAGTNCANSQETIHLRRLPRQTAVYDASGNIASLSTVEYDNYASDARHAAILARSGITGLCLARDAGAGSCTTSSTDSYLSRGNATSATSYGNAQAQTDAVTVSSKYDVAGNVVETKDGKGYVSTIYYADNFGAGNAEARTNTAPSALSGQSTYAFATSATNAAGYTSYTQFDYFSGLTVESEDINGNVSSVFYNDNLDRPTQVILANNRTSLRSQKTFAYNDGERKVTVTSDLFAFGDNLAKTESLYDKAGRTTETRNYKDGGYVKSEQIYDALGRAYKTSNPYYQQMPNPSLNGTAVYTTSEFDALGRVVKVKTPDVPTNAEVITSYSGNAVTVTDQSGKQRRSITNAVGQLKEVDEPDANAALTQATTYNYDTLGNLTQVNQGVQSRTFVYDSLSRLKSATNPESGLISYSYDANGNLSTKTDARSITTTFTYDNLNRVTFRDYSDATADVTYTYDDVNVSNSKGKLTKVSSSISQTEYTSFDVLGKVLAHKQTTDGQSYTTAYNYNLSGALIEQTYPSGRVVKNVLDNDGELSIVQSKKTANSGFWNYADNFTYTSAGAVSSMQLGNGRWESTQFNNRLQPMQIALGTTQGATNLLKLDYEYGRLDASGQTVAGTNNGNVSKQTITVPTTAQANGFTAVQYYAYDELNRIKQAAENLTPNGQATVTSWAQTFNYDRYGNRTFDEANTTTLPKNCGTAPNLTVCTSDQTIYNPSASTTNNRLNGYTYDASGNTTKDAQSRKFTYDAENKQTKVETVDANNNVIATIGEYSYDGDGKRVKKYVPSTGETTVFVYDASGKLVAEYANQIASASDAKVSYLTSDHLGSPRINTDQNGAVISRHDYQPFGEETQRVNYGGDSVKQKFTGYEKDSESGLDFAQARYFNSGVGRFSSPDYFANDTHVSDPQSWNLYAYVRNNPLVYTDPNGKDLWITINGTAYQYVRLDSQYKLIDANGSDYSPKEDSLGSTVTGFLSRMIDKGFAGNLEKLMTSTSRNDISVGLTDSTPSGIVKPIDNSGQIVATDSSVDINGGDDESLAAFATTAVNASEILGKPLSDTQARKADRGSADGAGTIQFDNNPETNQGIPDNFERANAAIQSETRSRLGIDDPNPVVGGSKPENPPWRQGTGGGIGDTIVIPKPTSAPKPPPPPPPGKKP